MLVFIHLRRARRLFYSRRREYSGLQQRARTHPDWNDFDNYAFKRIGEFYLARGLNRREVTKTPVWEIAQDLSGRIAIDQGLARAPDYRDELEMLIRERYKNRREFCKATGISEDMLSHVLARRKHLAIDTLNGALARIGYTLRIAPLEPTFQDRPDS